MKKYIWFVVLLLCSQTLTNCSYSYSYNSEKNYPGKVKHRINEDTSSFKSLFSLVRSISIEGTPEHPVHNVTNLAVRDSLIVVLERKSATLTAFNFRGELLYQAGGPGGAPGEFTNPYWVGFDAKRRLAVLEGPSNSRIQFLDPENGETLDVLTEGIRVVPFCDDVHFYRDSSGDHRVIFPTQAPCTSNKGGLCVIHKHSISSKRTIERFASSKKVRKSAIGVPWILDYENDNRIYVSHLRGGQINIYNIDGKSIGKVDISKSDQFKELDNSQFRKKYGKINIKNMLNERYSRVWNISVLDENILVHHFGKGRKNQSHRISVFDKESGKYITSTSEWKRSTRELIEVQGNRFFFVKTDRESEVGSYVVNEYRYKNN